jgi:hypothetical protein
MAAVNKTLDTPFLLIYLVSKNLLGKRILKSCLYFQAELIIIFGIFFTVPVCLKYADLANTNK